MSQGINNLKAGAHTSRPSCASTTTSASSSPTYNSPCVDASGNPLPGYASPSALRRQSHRSRIGNYLPVLAPYDLTRGGSDYHFFGHTDVKELALYIEDEIKAGNWDFNLGMRGDLYNGLTVRQPARAARGHCLQHQALQHRAARLLCAHAGDALQRKPRAFQQRMLRCRAVAAARVHSRRFGNPAARFPQRVPRQLPAGRRQECGGQRRVHLEVHPQRLRLQHPRQHADLLPHRLA